MTATDPDVLLDARLAAFFELRAESIAAEAPRVDEVTFVLDRRLRGRSPKAAGSKSPWSRLISVSPGTRRPKMSVGMRFAVLAVALILVVIAGLVVGPGHPGPSTSPSPSPVPSASSASVLAAPLGYQGSGVIEFTRHNAAGEDDVWLIDPSGANERLVVPGGCCGLFSPDGRQLAAAVPNGGPVNLGKGLLGVNLYPQPGDTVGGTIPGECGACLLSSLDSAPDAWSRDGTLVALDASSVTDRTRAGMVIAGDPPRWVFGTFALGPDEAHRDLPIAFSPDGTTLLFMREETTDGPTSIGPLFLLTIHDRTARRITPDGMTVSTNGLTQGPASWSPDGSKFAFAGKSTDSGDTSLYITTPAKGAKLTVIIPDANGATSAHFSPDGTWIAYDVPSPGGNFHDVHVVHPDGTGDRNLTADFAPGACCGQWSPEGEALLITATSSDDTHYDLYIVTAEGDVHRVTQTPNAYTAFLWGPTSN